MPRRDINDKERIEIVVLFFCRKLICIYGKYIYIYYMNDNDSSGCVNSLDDLFLFFIRLF